MKTRDGRYLIGECSIAWQGSPEATWTDYVKMLKDKSAQCKCNPRPTIAVFRQSKMNTIWVDKCASCGKWQISSTIGTDE